MKTSECGNVRAHKEKKREEELAGLQHDFMLKKEQLRVLVDQHGLRDVDPLGESCLSWHACRGDFPASDLSNSCNLDSLHGGACARDTLCQTLRIF